MLTLWSKDHFEGNNAYIGIIELVCKLKDALHTNTINILPIWFSLSFSLASFALLTFIFVFMWFVSSFTPFQLYFHVIYWSCLYLNLHLTHLTLSPIKLIALSETSCSHLNNTFFVAWCYKVWVYAIQILVILFV